MAFTELVFTKPPIVYRHCAEIFRDDIHPLRARNTESKSKRLPVPVAARSKAWVCSRLLAGIVGSNSAGGMDFFSVVGVVCCQVEVSASGWSLFQRSPAECGVSECDREPSIMRKPWPVGGFCPLYRGCYQIRHNWISTLFHLFWFPVIP